MSNPFWKRGLKFIVDKEVPETKKTPLRKRTRHEKNKSTVSRDRRLESKSINSLAKEVKLILVISHLSIGFPTIIRS